MKIGRFIGSDSTAVGDSAVPSSRVLIVDDEEGSRRALQRTLTRLGHEVELAHDGVEALGTLVLDIDLVMLDAEMPAMDGFELAACIRATPEYIDIPIIMVTGLDSNDMRLRAVAAGVNDFIAKPFVFVEVQLRTTMLLQLKQARDAIKRSGIDLEQMVQQRTADLRGALEKMAVAQRKTQEAHLDTIRRLVLAAEYKDRDTAMHVERIGLYSEVLAKGLNLAPGAVETIRYAAPMHDIGKLGIPDAILLKPGQLDEAEWAIMRQHTTIGANILQDSASSLLRVGNDIALTHHERWEGGGYPNNLQGAEIPVAGRICAVVDVFDALTSNRPYREALPNETVYDQLETQSGTHFDPEIVDVFFKNIRDIEAIQQECTRPASSRCRRLGTVRSPVT